MTQVIECASELGHKKIIATERSGLSAAKLSDVQIGIINFLLMRSLRYVSNAALQGAKHRMNQQLIIS